MSRLLRSCLDCGALSPTNRCSTHQAAIDRADNKRRHAKQTAHGRNTAHWQRVREQVIARDNGRCRRCGNPARSVHLAPELQGRHDLATAADCMLLCTSCHGAVDGGRANRT